MNKQDQLSKLLLLSPAYFAAFSSNGKWKIAKHLEILDRKLLELSRRDYNQLIVNMPPRHGKSELISKYFPAWYLANFPDHRIILTSYQQALAELFGRKVKAVLQGVSPYLPEFSISKSKYSSKSFDLEFSAGGMECTGVGGPLTGKGANLLIIDDPVKNDVDANSRTVRENIWEWFRATVFTRLEPDSIIIIIMTRWNEDDLCGKLEKEYKRDWQMLKLPAIAGNSDILGRSPGEPLWGERFPLKKLEKIKSTIGDYWFSALYQQSPAPSGGLVFKRSTFKYFNIENEFYVLDNSLRYHKSDCPVFATVDLAVSLKESADYTVIIIFALTPKRDILITGLIRERIEPSAHLSLLKSVFHCYKPSLIGIESTQYQISLVQAAQSVGLPVKPLKPDKDKLTRALPIAAQLEGGKVYFCAGTAWLFDFENELLNFPKGEKDDQVDCFAYISKMVEPISNAIPESTKKTLAGKVNISSGFD